MNTRLKTLSQLTAILFVAFALKSFYSTATANELRWILAPTTFLVEIVTGESFTFESHAGYMNYDHTFLIAASCSGVNFLIIAFLTLTLSKIWRHENPGWRYVPQSMIVAYLATIIANTARIAAALRLRGVDAAVFGLSGEDLHRLEGVVVYFGFLLLLFICNEKWEGRRASIASGALIPIAIYLGVTLGIPLAGGTFRNAAFWYHALFVISIPAFLIVGLLIFSFAKRRHSGIRDLR